MNKLLEKVFVGCLVATLIGGGIYGVFSFITWITKDPFDVVQERFTPVPTYRWFQCFDNDNPSFNQEYVDRRTDQIEKDHPGNCSWNMRGRQDILGCTGDLFYSYSCY